MKNLQTIRVKKLRVKMQHTSNQTSPSILSLLCMVVLGGCLALSGCESSTTTNPSASPDPVTDPDPNPDPDPIVGDPVPTGPPNAPNQTPAFPEQTRAPEITSNATPQTSIITSALSEPWGMVFLPSGDLLLTEKTGDVHMMTASGEISEPLSGIPNAATAGQGGMLDVNIHPDFANNRLVYLSYSENRGGGKSGTTVGRGVLANDNSDLNNFEVIFRQEPAWSSNGHFGTRLVWDNNGLLYVTLGERQRTDVRQLAQDTNTHIGKVVRIRDDGSVPDDNPFVAGDAPEVWSYGHRNPQGAALHPQTGALWTIEHGPQGGDELNKPLAGRNYGWPVITYGEDYNGTPIGDGITQKEGMEQPVYYWDPVIAPGGMTFYQGSMFEEWQGDLLIASLSPGELVRIKLRGDVVVGEERLVRDAGRVRDVIEAPDGSVWIATDAGKIIRLHL